MFKNLFFGILIFFVILNFSCSTFSKIKSLGERSEEELLFIPEDENVIQESEVEKEIEEVNSEKTEEHSDNHLIELSQEYYENGIYKMKNGDISGAIRDLETAQHILIDCELDSNQREVAREIHQDIFNQLVSMVYSKYSTEHENGFDSEHIHSVSPFFHLH